MLYLKELEEALLCCKMKSLGLKRTLSFDIRPTVLYILGRSLLLQSSWFDLWRGSGSRMSIMSRLWGMASYLSPVLVQGLIQEYFIQRVLHHVQACTNGPGPSPVVMSTLLGLLSDSSTLAPFSLVLSRTAP